MMASDNKRCTAMQFFSHEDQKSDGSISTYDRVVELLNQASLMQKDADKLTNLKMVEELIVNKEPNLLDNFLDEMLAFQSDKSVEIKKYVIHFMEQACKADPELLVRLSGVLTIMIKMAEENVAVVKKLVLCMAQIYKSALLWLAKSKSISDEMKQTWQTISKIKAMITDMIESDNDGIRTHAIKFLESIVIMLSYKTSDSEVVKANSCEPCLDLIPENHSLLKAKKLEEEGRQAFDAIMAYQSSQHISSVNLMTCMGSMTNIVRRRPIFMTRVVQAFESLHVNLPPTLSKSQVSSVRKNLKMQMLSLLRLPSSLDFQSNITTLLTDLGATQSEVAKSMPKPEEMRKRKAEDMVSAYGKKVKSETVNPIREEDDEDIIIPWQTSSSTATNSGASSVKPKAPVVEIEVQKQQTAIDITADDLIPRMTPQNVTDLVLLSMVMLPDSMPAQFQATYTPIAAAGTQVQIKHMSRLLAAQLTNAGLGRGISEVPKQIQVQPEKEAEPMEEDDVSSSKQVIETVVGGSTFGTSGIPISQPAAIALPTPVVQQATRKGIIQFKLSSVTKSLTRPQSDAMALSSFRRILAADKAAQNSCVSDVRAKILISLVSMYGGQLRDGLMEYIFADLRNRADLALAWIHQEYANFQGYNLAAAVPDKPSIANYNSCLTQVLTTLLSKPDQKEGLFSRIIMEAPSITPSAIDILKQYCQDDTRIYLGMTTLKELIVKRPCMKMEFLDILLNFTSHEKVEVRNNAIRVIKKLHERDDLRDAIEKYAMYYLKFLLQPIPPADIMSSKIKMEPGAWSEEAIKLCLYLYLGLLPVNHKLIHELANVYTATSGDIKRTILRVLETPVKGMGMESPELLLLVENCPRGAETLVTRVIHILTDKAVPSPELVDRVRDLYQKRVSDVRFLIPVLNGLMKKEVVAALPKLIKLNPIVVKEVFNRLLGVHGQENFVSPLTPAELLIALHGLDLTKVDMKTIIKACGLCFAEKTIYTQEVLAVVMQQLMEMNPIPTLLMRTVIQSLSMYPKLIGFVMNIMQRLITKQVWKNRKIWEGFVKCCQRTKPQSFQVLLQLPAIQLKDVFALCPELREPLLTHVQAFTPHQRAHIPKTIMSILEKDPHEDTKAVEKAKKAEDERLAQQEKIYQQKVEEERRKQQDLLKQKMELQKSVERQKSTEMATNRIQAIGSSSSGSYTGAPVKNEPNSPIDDDASFYQDIPATIAHPEFSSLDNDIKQEDGKP